MEQNSGAGHMEIDLLFRLHLLLTFTNDKKSENTHFSLRKSKDRVF
jgi:hypothetical protein